MKKVIFVCALLILAIAGIFLGLKAIISGDEQSRQNAVLVLKEFRTSLPERSEYIEGKRFYEAGAAGAGNGLSALPLRKGDAKGDS